VPSVRRLLTLVFLAFSPLALEAQLEPPTTGGYPALDLAMRMLGHHKRVLMIGAHPDDEDTELLTVLVRGAGAEAAYLSLTRGEGGQNLIGDELGEALGLLRTEELLAARRLDGARQFFTRAYDFGFSKSLDDTWAHWPRDSILKDVVRTVRRFRPQVIVSVFTGASRDGHGQHQAAGWAAREAFQAAGDPTVFPELLDDEGLPAFAPLKLYRSTRFDSAATTLVLEGGELDPALGQSFHQIAMRGRSLHRSQDMGQLQRLGPSQARLQLLYDRTGRGEAGLWSGVDTALVDAAGIASLAPDKRRHATVILERYGARLDSARALVAASLRGQLRVLLSRATADLESAQRLSADRPGSRANLHPDLAGDAIEEELRRLGTARARSLDLIQDAVSEDARVIPGQRVRVTASLWNPGDSTVPARLCLGRSRVAWRLLRDSVSSSELSRTPKRGSCLGYNGRAGAWAPLAGAGDPLPARRLAVARVEAGIPESEDYTTPYFLRLPRAGDLYQWDPEDRASWGLPFEESLLNVAMELEPATWETREVTFRGNDQATGEFRRPVVVVPRVGVRVDPELDIWPVSHRGPRTFTVTLTHGARDTTSGRVALRLPAGWPQPPSQVFRLTREDEQVALRFSVRPPTGPAEGLYEVAALATDARGRVFDVGMRRVDHAHTRPRTWARRATAAIRMADLALPRLRRVAYVRGAADRVPEALATVGLPVDLLRGADLARDLGRYDVIVVGPRAFETDPDLRTANSQLLAYARSGGTVVVQYQQYAYFLGGFPPFPLTVGSRSPGTPSTAATVARPDSTRAPTSGTLGGHDRVVDEAAPVTQVEARSPVFRHPNRIGPRDWDGWVQERGLYFARTWDPAWQPLLAMNDPGEPALRGGLLLARVGKGRYVYTGLSLFRQLPAGVPGAWRLFLNLLALGERRAIPSRLAPSRDTLKVERE
jgi:LmbE family N-acetylglucosaminyl deacetylase